MSLSPNKELNIPMFKFKLKKHFEGYVRTCEETLAKNPKAKVPSFEKVTIARSGSTPVVVETQILYS
ncbi:hypothetical protein K2173_019780 [Erythroxylum novogranatense]|uniref:Uncharacterized protein n=1 Tax=Erythroxylum novogranatense TaxID=1862640 RepID=A0AAV8SM64_9ROSI|nr:hypothetical protein K2173_019780 [Erythroxylum novogranatense]